MAKAKSKGRVRANGLGTVSYDKQRDSWFAKILTGYNAESGKPVYVKRRAKTKTDAEKLLNDLHAEKKTGRLAPATGLNVGDYLESWISALPSSLSPNTRRSYKEMVKNHFKPELGKRRLADLSAGEIEALYRRLEDKGFTRIPSYAHRVLSIALTEAVRLGFLPKSPMERVKSPKVVQKRSENFHTAEETVKLLKHLETETDSSVKALMLLGIETGARFSELVGVTWKVIDFESRLLIIQAQLSREEKTWLLRPLKTAKSERMKILSKEVIEALKSERGRQTLEGYSNPLGLALLNADGRPWEHSHGNMRIKQICKSAGVREFPSHTLFRHTYATSLLKSGVSMHDASREMGHGNVNLTANLYGHHAMESTRTAASTRHAYLDKARKAVKQKPADENSSDQ